MLTRDPFRNLKAISGFFRPGDFSIEFMRCKAIVVFTTNFGDDAGELVEQNALRKNPQTNTVSCKQLLREEIFYYFPIKGVHKKK